MTGGESLRAELVLASRYENIEVAERALRDSEAKYRTLFELARDGLAHLGVGPGGLLGGDFQSFLGLDGLVQPVAPAPARHQPSGELVHDHHLAAVHHVVDVLLEERAGAQELVDAVRRRAGVELGLDGVEQAVGDRVGQHLSGVGRRLLGDGDLLVEQIPDGFPEHLRVGRVECAGDGGLTGRDGAVALARPVGGRGDAGATGAGSCEEGAQRDRGGQTSA